MKILLLGASSYLGARIYFDLQNNYDVTGTFSSTNLSVKFLKLDITDTRNFTEIFDRVKPDITIHAANNASAKWCDANPDAAILLNATATDFIIKAVKKSGGRLIYISSMSAEDQSNIYGKTKSASEKQVRDSALPYLILRPSLILGYSPNTLNDRPFNRLLRNIEGKSPAIYDTAWKFQPTYIRQISQVISACIEKGIDGMTITVASPELTSRYQSACEILTPFGIPVTAIRDQQVPPLITDSLELLDRYSLPRYPYEQIIENIIKEIRDRKRFVL